MLRYIYAASNSSFKIRAVPLWYIMNVLGWCAQYSLMARPFLNPVYRIYRSKGKFQHRKACNHAPGILHLFFYQNILPVHYKILLLSMGQLLIVSSLMNRRCCKNSLPYLYPRFPPHSQMCYYNICTGQNKPLRVQPLILRFSFVYYPSFLSMQPQNLLIISKNFDPIERGTCFSNLSSLQQNLIE